MSPQTFISRATTTAAEAFAIRRPWRQFLSVQSLRRPVSLTEFKIRIKQNLLYFRVNYAMIILSILCLSLLYHPTSLIVFIIIYMLWHFLYFTREEPLMISGRTIDDRAVMATLFIVTVVGVGLTKVWVNVLVSVVVGVAAVVVHAGFRGTEDLYLDEEDSGLSSFVSSPTSTAPYNRI